MKRIICLLTSLFTIPFIFSCSDNHKVNEKEFNKAFANEGIEYLQMNTIMSYETASGEKSIIGNVITEVAPNIYYIMRNIPKDYEEIYTVKDRETYNSKQRTNKDADFSNVTPEEIKERPEHYYNTPYTLSLKHVVETEGLDIGFKDFTYKSGKYEYIPDASASQNNFNDLTTQLKYVITFTNKKISKFDTVFIDAMEEDDTMIYSCECTYKKIVPKNPEG